MDVVPILSWCFLRQFVSHNVTDISENRSVSFSYEVKVCSAKSFLPFTDQNAGLYVLATASVA